LPVQWTVYVKSRQIMKVNVQASSSSGTITYCTCVQKLEFVQSKHKHAKRNLDAILVIQYKEPMCCNAQLTNWDRERSGGRGIVRGNKHVGGCPGRNAWTVEAPAQQRSQVISRSENPPARTPGCTFSSKQVYDLF